MRKHLLLSTRREHTRAATVLSEEDYGKIQRRKLKIFRKRDREYLFEIKFKVRIKLLVNIASSQIRLKFIRNRDALISQKSKTGSWVGTSYNKQDSSDSTLKYKD